MGFDPSGPSEWGCWAKSHGTHNAPFFRQGSLIFPGWKNTVFFYLFFIGNRGPLMLACSNVHVYGELSIFCKTFSTAF